MLGISLANGFSFEAKASESKNSKLYDVPRFGNVHLLHFTDCHAQLLPNYFREPDANLGVGAAAGRPPHLVGEALLRRFPDGQNPRGKTSTIF